MTDVSKYGNIVDFLFETGILAKTPRSGFYFLGSGEQSVAEHISRTAYIGFTLGLMTPGCDVGKVIKMCLLHDLHETRISDLNHVHQKYTERFEHKATEDLVSTLPFGQEMADLIAEYEERKTIEARLAKDADRLEWLMALKEQFDTGNTRAAGWMKNATQRMDTEIAQKLAKEILATDSDRWWLSHTIKK